MTEVATQQQTRPAGSPKRDQLVTRRFATGVSVLTCGTADRVEGVTVSTIALASVAPPILSIALREGSRGLATLLSTATFVVNSLSAQQAPLAKHFASRRRTCGVGQLPDAAWAGQSESGTPLLSDAVAWLECQTRQTITIGDHRVVFATVLNATHGAGTPLVSFAGTLHPGLSRASAPLTERDR